MPRARTNLTYDGRTVLAGEELDALELPAEAEAEVVTRGDADSDESKPGSNPPAKKPRKRAPKKS